MSKKQYGSAECYERKLAKVMKRLGIEEEWRDSPSFPAYSISSYGRVKRIIRSVSGVCPGRFIRPRATPKGYLQVTLRKDNQSCHLYLHRLVAEAFIGSCPPGYECNHKDGDKSNNHYSNLEWTSREKNMKHAWKTGLVQAYSGQIGVNNPKSKLDDEKVIEVFRLRQQGLFQADIAQIMGVSQAAISAILRRKNWGHVDISSLPEVTAL